MQGSETAAVSAISLELFTVVHKDSLGQPEGVGAEQRPPCSGCY